MTPPPSRILFATRQPTLLWRFREVLTLSGFVTEPVMLKGLDWATVRREDPCLIFVDARTPSSGTFAKAVRRSPHSRFVLIGGDLTPELLRSAIEAGFHGVLSTSLCREEAAQAVVRIWNGERQFRFNSTPRQPAVPKTSASEDFDAAWMFGDASAGG